MIEIKIEDHPQNVVIINIAGEFYIENIQKVEGIWQEQVKKRPSVIGVNCADLLYIDSSAIGTLVKFLNNAMNKNIKLVFFDLNASIGQIFKTARLNNFFTITTKDLFNKEYLPSKK